MPDHLMGVAEIATYLGVSRQRVHQLAASAGFPEPEARLTMGTVWTRESVESWAQSSGRR